MPSQAMKRKNCNENPLDPYEDRMMDLYVRDNLPLDRVRELIDAESGQKVPKSRYLAKIKERGWNKNLKGGDAKNLAIALTQRSRNKRESRLYFWGRQLPQDEVHQIVSRSRPTTLELLGSPQLPRGYSIRTPSPKPIPNAINNIEDLLTDMPWLEIEKALDHMSLDPKYHHTLAIVPISRHADPKNVLVGNIAQIAGGNRNITPLNSDVIGSLGPSFFTNNPRALATLESALPPSVIRCRMASGPHIEYGAITVDSFEYRAFLFSMANSFAGLSGFRVEEIFQAFEGINVDVLSHLFRLIRGPTARAIAQNLFKIAVESGSHAIVDAILSTKGFGINVNEEMLFGINEFYTPIQRASLLGHNKTIETLLSHGATTNQPIGAFPSFYEREELSSAREIDSYSEIESYKELDIDLFRLWSDRADVIPFDLILSLINRYKHDRVCYLIREHVQKCIWHKPYRRGSTNIFVLLFHDLSERDALDIIAGLAKIERPNMLNPAAAVGYKMLFEQLRSTYNLCPDNDTLCCAIWGGNRYLIRTLLLGEASVQLDLDSPSRFSSGFRFYGPCTPLSLAITMRDKETVDLLRHGGVFNRLGSSKRFKLAWEAAVVYDNFEVLDELLRGRSSVPVCLGQALELACEAKNHQFAQRLLNLGAHATLSLKAAIKSRDIGLIELLLDSGAEATLDEGSYLTLAVEMGNHLVVGRLLAEGIEHYQDALHAALKKGDEKLVEMLLDAGANINGGALRVVAETGNVSLTKYILAKGADPNDPHALEKAFRANRAVFEMLLAAHKQRYNYRKKGFCSAVLYSAIEDGDIALIKHLLDHNADPHGFVEKDRQYVTSFGHAIVMDNSEGFTIVKPFLQAGCRPHNVVSRLDYIRIKEEHSIEKEEEEPLHTISIAPRTTAFLAAIATKNVDLVRALVQDDETIIHAPARGSFKRTALQRAAEVGSIAMVKMIHNMGADINEPPNRIAGATVLQLAAIGGFLEIVCYLIQKGANINAPGALIKGMTALVGAASKGRMDVLSVLLKAAVSRDEFDNAQLEAAIEIAGSEGYPATRDYLQQWYDRYRHPGDEFINYSPYGED
ncbi:ankyrin [Nemania abortiva]|nr:ankyrin [Nemania abortiva]